MKTFQDLKKTLFNKNPFKRFNNKHTKLREQQQQQSCTFDNDNQEQVFYGYYIGNTILSYDSSEGNASSCISRIIETAKLYKNKNRKKVTVNISIKGFRINDCETAIDIIDASIYRVSYVTVSKANKNIYAFIYQNPVTKLIECHAFDCKSKNYAKCILRTSFIAFNLAYDTYYKEKDVKKRAVLLGEIGFFDAKTSFLDVESKVDRRSSILSRMCMQEVRNSSYIARKWLSRTGSCKNPSKNIEYSKLENSENDDEFDYYYDVDSDEDEEEHADAKANHHGSMISV